MIVALIVYAGAGCGSSSRTRRAEPPDPARAAAEARREEIDAMKPASPYELRERTAYRPTERCGQGPYRLETPSLGAAYGERLLVYACGKHAIKGNYRITAARAGRAEDTSEAAFGFDRDNAACRSREIAGGAGGGASSGGARGQASGGAGARGTAAAPSTIEPRALEPATAIPAGCVRSQLLDHTFTTDRGIAIDARFVIDVWSEVPNDLEGLVFVIERSGVRADMTPEGWRAYQDAWAAHHEAYMANLALEVAAGRTTIVNTEVKAPPPPPPRAETPPPRPSRNARWIPGYWHYEATRFHWIAGLWDVPEEDVRRALTVHAPTPPPEVRTQDRPTEPRPARTAVWTPGSWQWDGHAYVWIGGAWRIPPDPRHTWQRPTWNVRAGRAVYVPGGWRVRVRLGR